MTETITYLKELDTELFIYLNGLHSQFWDFVMFWISNKFIWVPLYLVLFWIVIKDFKYRSIVIILTLIIIIAVSDQASVHLFKNNFERLRPCHDASLADIIHTVRDKCGGHFGFISSHASNSFALAVFLSGFIRRRYRYFPLFIFIWASVVSYSRIYLGVHYPADVAGGAVFGSILGYLALSFYRPGFFKK